MEIEKKFLVDKMPDLTGVKYFEIEQGYLCTDPVVRIRKKGDSYILTYKGAGLMAREEIEAPLTKEAYEHLAKKIDGNLITKKRYIMPYMEHTIELDIFYGHMSGLVIAEVEFETIEKATSFVPPEWFGTEVTEDNRYHNSNMIFSNPFKDG